MNTENIYSGGHKVKGQGHEAQKICLRAGADPGVEIGGHMASAEREPIMGVWGLCPQRGPGAESLVRGQSPLKLNTFWCCHMSEMALSCYVYELFYGH